MKVTLLMNNIYTEIETILSPEMIDNSYEISELADAPVLAIIEKEGEVTWEGTCSELEALYVLEQYKFKELLPAIDGVDLTILGYVVGREFFVFSVFQAGEEYEMLPERRANFMEFFNLNLVGVKLRHVPVFPQVLKLEGAKTALANRSKPSDVQKYTTKAIVELCEGLSPMTKKPRKGLVFKSLNSHYSFKALSEYTMVNMMGSL